MMRAVVHPTVAQLSIAIACAKNNISTPSLLKKIMGCQGDDQGGVTT